MIDDVVSTRHWHNSQDRPVWAETLQRWAKEMPERNREETLEEILPLWYFTLRFCSPNLSSWTHLCAGLLVPASSDKMLRKSPETSSDVIVYDLEDGVPPTRADKDAARDRLSNFLTAVRSCR